MVVLVSHLGEATLRAFKYADMIGADAVRALHVKEERDEEFVETWPHLFPDTAAHRR